ncbi:hypothetical protein [Sphingomonas phyllosphaerae]|uniref:hypothetical protein n=1 Tax=Sphingomonas phyllosphaerae TaxID=257003 RepID=UPI002413C891|nr:hypothetical protein [Sphingomonas phyllosphaerae]
MAQGWQQYPAHGATNGNADWGEPAGKAAVAADPLPPAKAKAGEGKRLRLENGAQIRREMVKVYRGMKVGAIDTSKGSKLIYALTELSRALERETVEKLTERLDEVEGK